MPRMIPDGRTTPRVQIPSTVHPNIRSKTPSHTECWRQEWHSPMGRLGDVRRCVHGRVQVLTRISENARVQGPGTHWWRTLSPFWNPITYQRARKALNGV